MSLTAAFLAGLLIAAGQRGGEDDWYPPDITPPEGTRYPCALTALPRGLPGIPEDDRRYINHAYALILKATHAKLVVLKAVQENADPEAALYRYEAEVRVLADRLRNEPVPRDLEPFRDDVLEALGLQQAFFRQAVQLRGAGRSMHDVYRIPDGRAASSRLVSAWGRMQRRYRSWSRETRESIYHHLCALDLF